MTKIRGMAGIAGVLAMLAAGAPARATSCWRNDAASAARIREFQSMLMVETLRCRSSGTDISGIYDAFVTAERPVFAITNAALRGHFGAGDAGAADYDHFITSLANAYGAGGGHDIGCDAAASLAQAAAAAGSEDALLAFAGTSVPARDLPGGACPIEPSAPVTLAAAEPVTLAPEIVAALETIAAFTRQQAAPPAPSAAPPVRVASVGP